MTFGVERGTEATDDQAANRRRIAEANLGLGGVHINVDVLQRHLDEQRCDRMSIAGDEIAIGGAQSADEEPVFHRPPVDEEILPVGHAAIEGRKTDHTGQRQLAAPRIDADAVPIELMSQELGDPRRRVRRLQRQDSAAVMLEAEGDVGPGHRKPLHGIEAGGIFGAGTAQELAPRRNLVEQRLDTHASPRRKRSRRLSDPRSMVHLDPPPVAAPAPAVERQA